MEEIFNVIDSNFGGYKSFWVDICNIESKSVDKDGVNEVSNYIERFCLEKGFHVKRCCFERAGDYLSVSMNEDSHLPGIIFMAHMDTVHEKGKFGYPAVKEDSEYLYGPGVTDCKGGIAIALLCMDVLNQRGYKKRPLKLILTSDEEVSNVFSGQKGMDFIANESKGCSAAFSCESGITGNIIVGRKGIVRCRVNILGRAAHSGMDYSSGISAIREAAYKIIDIEKESNGKKTTYNCGVVEGGEAVNIIPESCSFDLDIRFVSQEDLDSARRHVKSIVSRSYLKGTKATLTEISRRLPMECTKGNLKLFNQVKDACDKYSLEEIQEYYSGGGSDAAYAVLAGVPSVCAVGAEGELVHTVFEKAKISTLTSRAKMLASTVLELPDNF